MNKKLTILSALCLFIASCGSKEVTVSAFINDPANKIFQQIHLGDVDMSMKYLPYDHPDFDRRNGLERDSTTDADFYFFNARLSKLTGDKPDKEKMLYLDFDMQNDFVLVQNGDSIPASICQKIESGKPGLYEYMLAFEKVSDEVIDAQKDFTITYNDKIFGIGTIDFVYRSTDIGRIPK